MAPRAVLFSEWFLSLIAKSSDTEHILINGTSSYSWPKTSPLIIFHLKRMGMNGREKRDTIIHELFQYSRSHVS